MGVAGFGDMINWTLTVGSPWSPSESTAAGDFSFLVYTSMVSSWSTARRSLSR